jgi:hypothetical protein
VLVTALVLPLNGLLLPALEGLGLLILDFVLNSLALYEFQAVLDLIHFLCLTGASIDSRTILLTLGLDFLFLAVALGGLFDTLGWWSSNRAKNGFDSSSSFML